MEYESERQLQHDILIFFGALPWLTIWRNNTGMAYGYSQVKCLVGFLKKGDLRGALGFFKIMQPIQYSTIGAADIIGVMQPSGRFLAIECKGAKEKPNESQAAWGRMVEDRGGLHIVAWQVRDVYGALQIAEAFGRATSA